jgi:hypothetical protein
MSVVLYIHSTLQSLPLRPVELEERDLVLPTRRHTLDLPDLRDERRARVRDARRGHSSDGEDVASEERGRARAL